MDPVPMFRSCDLNIYATLEDSTNGVLHPAYQFMRATEDSGMFIIGSGSLSPQAKMIVREVRFAATPGSGEGCDQPPPDYAVRVRGIDPPWLVSIRNTGIELTREGDPSRIAFPATQPADTAGWTRYRATTPDGEHTLEVSLEPGQCTLGSYAAVTSLKATVVLDGVQQIGCAWEGRER